MHLPQTETPMTIIATPGQISFSNDRKTSHNLFSERLNAMDGSAKRGR